MFGIGPTELLVILVVALLVLGPKRLPELARSLGKGLAEFRRATADVTAELDEARMALERETREASLRAGAKTDRSPKPTSPAEAAKPETYSRTPAAQAGEEKTEPGATPPGPEAANPTDPGAKD